MATPKKSSSKDTKSNQLKAHIKELTLALQRERADAINLRRRHEEELIGLRNRLKANVVRELLPVIDNLERSLKHVPKGFEDSDYVKGINVVVKQFEKSLDNLGVEKIKTVGEPFDPRIHEAVSLDEGNGQTEIVSQELLSGYMVNGEIIRHAMVKVIMQ